MEMTYEEITSLKLILNEWDFQLEVDRLEKEAWEMDQCGDYMDGNEFVPGVYDIQ